MVLYSRSSAAEGTHKDPAAGLEESVRRLGLGNKREDCLYPERPGEQDCGYFVRTGFCAYGMKCRYNHPAGSSSTLGALGYPERVGQPDCEYFLKTGKCKYGYMCKYHHPNQGAGSVSLNSYGYPLRQGVKDCFYFVKTGQCKYGSDCRYHHPQLISSTVPSPASPVYPMLHPTLVPPQQYPSLGGWQVGGPSVSPTSYMPGSYGPMLISPSIVPGPGWSPYPQSPVSPVLSPDGQAQQMVQGLSLGLLCQSGSSTPVHPGPYPMINSSSGAVSAESMLPERPGQPICQHYLKMGSCKHGTMCRYHHPPAYRPSYSSCIFSPLGLPLRPGTQPCPDFAQHGACNFGHTCKYDHPGGALSYSPSASSFSDMPVIPYPIGFPLGATASYPELHPSFLLPRKDNVIIQELT